MHPWEAESHQYNRDRDSFVIKCWRSEIYRRRACSAVEARLRSTFGPGHWGRRTREITPGHHDLFCKHLSTPPPSPLLPWNDSIFFSKMESKETKGNYQENDDGIECLQISLTFKRWRRKIYNNWTRDIKRNKERAPPICITKKSPFLLFIHLLYF